MSDMRIIVDDNVSPCQASENSGGVSAHSRVHQSSAALSRNDEQAHDRIAIQTREPFVLRIEQPSKRQCSARMAASGFDRNVSLVSFAWGSEKPAWEEVHFQR